MSARRTREHIIADLSVNHFERFVLRCEHTAQRVHFDYGYDLWVQTFDAEGNLESGYILVQLKASDNIRWFSDRQNLAISVRRADVENWLQETNEVLLILYDASADQAYYLEVQHGMPDDVMAQRGEQTVTLRIPAANKLDEATIRKTCDRKRSRIRAATERN